jgi:hypothetical protein
MTTRKRVDIEESENLVGFEELEGRDITCSSLY